MSLVLSSLPKKCSDDKSAGGFGLEQTDSGRHELTMCTLQKALCKKDAKGIINAKVIE